MDVRTRLAIEELDQRLVALSESAKILRADLAQLVEQSAIGLDRLGKLEERVGTIKVAQGFHAKPIDVPPPPKILRDIGLLPPLRPEQAGEP